MEYEKIKQLMEDMGNSKLSSIDIEFPDGTKVKMEKKPAQIVTQNLSEVRNVSVNDIGNGLNSSNETILLDNQLREETVSTINNTNNVNNTGVQEGRIVKSPMIGTFYMKPSPTSKPYVEKGSCVKKGDVLCIIEAMKLMNEIESEYDGEILEILVKDGEPVDYGKPLFRMSI